VDKAPIADDLKAVAVIERADGATLDTNRGDLAITAGWGIPQARAVMPGAGRYTERERTAAETASLSGEQREDLGEQVVDVYLNASARWSGVPAAAWDYKIGGFQVLRKWLSYCEQRVLGRDLTVEEARTFTRMARRLTALVLLGPALDANYVAITESPIRSASFSRRDRHWVSRVARAGVTRRQDCPAC
jgi:hypothetical protein